jgi:hypothetical protein
MKKRHPVRTTLLRSGGLVLPVTAFLHDLGRLAAAGESVAFAGSTGCGQQGNDHREAQELFHGRCGFICSCI